MSLYIPGCPGCSAALNWDSTAWLEKAHHALETTKLNPNAIWRLHEKRGRQLYASAPNDDVDLGGEA